jgi:hypothetical protein
VRFMGGLYGRRPRVVIRLGCAPASAQMLFWKVSKYRYRAVSMLVRLMTA